jgi:hypothetical protein
LNFITEKNPEVKKSKFLEFFCYPDNVKKTNNFQGFLWAVHKGLFKKKAEIQKTIQK